ncbi:MAG: hypothetical protein M1834_001409 [Cirrosporium novae-zelandiae]|nr:MAG: hypothetical protein M1834_001409 [Cirrosporium novae-zelandiae]
MAFFSAHHDCINASQGSGLSDGDKTPIQDGAQIPVVELPDRDDFEKHNHGWRMVVRNFHPGFFGVNMGTGICSTLVSSLPYDGEWIYYVSMIMWCLNILLFCIFIGISLIRYIMYPEIISAIFRNPNHAIFLGTFPMALTTIENLMVFVWTSHSEYWGIWIVYLAWVCWWIDAFISAALCFYVPYLIMTNDRVSHLTHMSAAWLLPIAPTVVAASSGAIVASALPNPHHAFTTIIFSYVLWGIGMSMSFIVIGVYFHRLAVHKLPARKLMATVFFPIGPTGSGTFAIQRLGSDAREILPRISDSGKMAGEILYVVGLLMGLLIWGFALCWLVYGLVAVYMTRRFPFNMGWWTFVFPFGAYTTGTVQLGKGLPSSFFTVVGLIWTICTVLVWLLVSAGTVRGLITGKALADPVLEDLRPEMTLPKEGREEKPRLGEA